MAEFKAGRIAEEKLNAQLGNPGDVDFQRMIKKWRAEKGAPQGGGGGGQRHRASDSVKICVCCRKRPTSERERRRKDHDCITCLNPIATVHDCKLRVDGISKYLSNNDFAFDHTFDEAASNEDVYDATVETLVRFVVRRGGLATCFAYGQTGSGKTHTMTGIQELAARDLFRLVRETPPVGEGGQRLEVCMSMFEIYGGRCQDLLNQRRRLAVREDGNGEVVIAGLEELKAEDEEDLLALIERGNRLRTTHATENNDTSSRSHAICQFKLIDVSNRRQQVVVGKLSLIDLAGSERGADTKSHNRQRRLESAEINKSLLALKECIRALDNSRMHVPYRASKLTLVLKDMFTSENARTVMIATVSPGVSSVDHSVNTLRYADRIKEVHPAQARARAAAAGLREEERDTTPPPPALRTDGEAPAGGQRPGEMSPTAQRLVAASRAARDGHITAEEKARLKRDILKENGSAQPPPPPPSSTEAAAGGAQQPARRSNRGGGGGGMKSALEREREKIRERERRRDRERNQKRAQLASGREHSSDLGAAGDDIKYLHQSLKRDSIHAASIAEAAAAAGGGQAGGDDGDVRATGGDDAANGEAVAELHQTVQSLYEEEEMLLNAHMNSIQENAELLTEEGRLLAHVQGEDVVDYDIDGYAGRLEEILNRKSDIIAGLRTQLATFRRHLQEEESASRRVNELPLY